MICMYRVYRVPVATEDKHIYKSLQARCYDSGWLRGLAGMNRAGLQTRTLRRREGVAVRGLGRLGGRHGIMGRVKLMMEDGLEARSHNFGTGCQYCGVDYGRKVDAALIPSLLKTAPTFSLVHDGRINVPRQRTARYGYLSQSIVSCLRLSLTSAIPYVSVQRCMVSKSEAARKR